MGPLGRGTALDERAQDVFKLLVQRYIRDGRPVGSRTLSREIGQDLSPATIRNVMADLEDLGLVRAPHTSAGRVPTVQGYRLFVDTMLHVEPVNRTQALRVEQELDAAVDPESLVESASALLSQITHLAGIVMLPRHERLTLRQIEFLPLSENRVLTILVINEREVQNRIIRTDRTYSQSELQTAAAYLNELCAGQDLLDTRERLLRELRTYRESMNHIMVAAIEMADQALQTKPDGDDFVVAGETNLMEYGELADMGKLRHLFEAFHEKRDLLHLLDQCVRAEALHIFIGEESGYDVLDECSVIAAPYANDGRIVGVLGVIGPTRMAYDRVIPIVDITARLMGAALNKAH